MCLRPSPFIALPEPVRTTSFVPRPLPSCLALVLACTALPPAAAQSFGDALKRTVERAAKSEVQRKVDQETREVTRCAMGDARCVREAERRGERVEYEDDAAAGAAAGVAGGDHPLIVPYQGSRLRERKADAFNEYQRVVGRDRGQTRTQRLEGRLTRLRYDNPSGRSTFEIERNYRSALTARGFRVDWECSGRDVCGTTAGPASPGWNTINGINLGIARDVRYFTGKLRHGGGEAYVSVAVNPQVTYVHVLEAAAMDTGMVAVDADALAAGLAQDGKVTLEGLYFDTGRATLQAASDPALEQAALLMKQQPALKLLVVGHTDSTGSAAANLKLSQQRAEAVRAALVARGIAASRLSAQGVGSSAPVASNDSESGRAQNRRVELVKR